MNTEKMLAECRAQWEASNGGSVFADYWLGWKAAREALVIDFSDCNIQHASYNNVDCYAISDVKIITDRYGVKCK